MDAYAAMRDLLPREVTYVDPKQVPFFMHHMTTNPSQSTSKKTHESTAVFAGFDVSVRRLALTEGSMMDVHSHPTVMSYMKKNFPKDCFARTWIGREVLIEQAVGRLRHRDNLVNMPLMLAAIVDFDKGEATVIREAHSMTLREYSKLNAFSAQEVKGIITQLYAGLHTLQYHLGIVHHDISLDTVTVSPYFNGPPTLNYMIYGKNVPAPTFGKIIRITDFALADSPNLNHYHRSAHFDGKTIKRLLILEFVKSLQKQNAKMGTGPYYQSDDDDDDHIYFKAGYSVQQCFFCGRTDHAVAKRWCCGGEYVCENDAKGFARYTPPKDIAACVELAQLAVDSQLDDLTERRLHSYLAAEFPEQYKNGGFVYDMPDDHLGRIQNYATPVCVRPNISLRNFEVIEDNHDNLDADIDTRRALPLTFSLDVLNAYRMLRGGKKIHVVQHTVDHESHSFTDDATDIFKDKDITIPTDWEPGQWDALKGDLCYVDAGVMAQRIGGVVADNPSDIIISETFYKPLTLAHDLRKIPSP